MTKLNIHFYALLKPLLLIFSIGAILSCNSQKTIENAKELAKDSSYLPGDTYLSDSLPLEYPELKELVNDYADIFTQEQIDSLTRIVLAHEEATSNQIAIATFQHIPIPPEKFEDFANKLADHTGIGQKEKNNGVFIVLWMEQSKVTIRTGSGMVAKLPDTLLKKIIDEIMVPEYKKTDFFEGTLKGLLTIIEKIKQP